MAALRGGEGLLELIVRDRDIEDNVAFDAHVHAIGALGPARTRTYGVCKGWIFGWSATPSPSGSSRAFGGSLRRASV